MSWKIWRAVRVRPEVTHSYNPFMISIYVIFTLNSQTTAIIKVKSKSNMGITVLVDLILGKK